MAVAIQVIWWIGLVGALALTLVVLKEVFLVVRMLRDMLHLAERILKASRGITENVGAAPALAGLDELLSPLPAGLSALTDPLRSIAGRLGAGEG